MSNNKPSDRYLRFALIAWGIFALALTAKGLVQPMHRTVYTAFVAGSQDFWAGKEEFGRDGWYYGPTFAVLFGPFAHLPNPLGATLWNWVNLGVYFYALRKTYREVIAPRWPQIRESAFLALVLLGSARSLWSAQTNAILIACLLLAGMEIMQRCYWRAALLLALPVHQKIWPIAAGMLFIAQRPKPLLARCALCLTLLAAVPLLVQPPDYVARYYQSWYQTLAERQGTAERWVGYRDAWTAWELLIGPVNPRLYTAAQLAGAAVVLAGALWLRYKRSDERLALLGTLGLWASWQMLLGPGSERLTIVILAPFAAWLVLQAHAERRGRVLASAGFILAFVLGFGEIERDLALVFPYAQAMLPLGVAVIGVSLISTVFASRPGECGLRTLIAPAEDGSENRSYGHVNAASQTQ